MQKDRTYKYKYKTNTNTSKNTMTNTKKGGNTNAPTNTYRAMSIRREGRGRVQINAKKKYVQTLRADKQTKKWTKSSSDFKL